MENDQLQTKPESANLLPFDGDVYFYPDFFSKEEADQFLNHLLSSTAWKHEPVIIMGKKVMQPRLTAWYGDSDKPYSYTGITMTPNQWTPILLDIKRKVEAFTGHRFTSALINYYRDGNDSVGWHRDKEKTLGKEPVIASVSFGATRRFLLKHVVHKDRTQKLLLTHGSLLIMSGTTQQFWQHTIPKEPKIQEGRINITFRTILSK